MLKVFVVEDEIVVREGIKKNIAWEEHGLCFVGEASDGELALPMIQETKPDIIITDIKMPFMDGLELSRHVKKESPNTKIIILSGYSEFSYAKQAISIGVTDYLLKPISPEKLLESVLEVKTVIEKEREQLDFYEKFELEMQESKRLEKQKFFNDLVTKGIAMTEVIERAESLELNIVSPIYNIVLFHVMRKGQTVTSYSEAIVQITEVLELMTEQNPSIYMFDRSGEGWGFLVLGDLANAPGAVEQLFLPIIEKIAQYEDLEYFGGIGKPVQRLRELPESFDFANRAFAYRYMGNTNKFITQMQLDHMNMVIDEGVDIGSFDITRVDRRIIKNFLKSGTEEEVKHFVAEYIEGLGRDTINSLLFRQYIVMDIYFVTVAFAEELGMEHQTVIDEFGEIKDVANQLMTVERTQSYIEKILMKTMQYRDGVTRKKYSSLIDTAIAYMKANFANEEISLNSVAAEVNMSPSYFSSIFSQEVGKTFIEYLTGIRMEKAKELLMCTNMRTSEIGFEVGYKEPHYFSYIFKKTQDCSPKEFRTRG